MSVEPIHMKAEISGGAGGDFHCEIVDLDKQYAPTVPHIVISLNDYPVTFDLYMPEYDDKGDVLGLLSLHPNFKARVHKALGQALERFLDESEAQP